MLTWSSMCMWLAIFFNPSGPNHACIHTFINIYSCMHTYIYTYIHTYIIIHKIRTILRAGSPLLSMDTPMILPGTSRELSVIYKSLYMYVCMYVCMYYMNVCMHYMNVCMYYMNVCMWCWNSDLTRRQWWRGKRHVAHQTPKAPPKRWAAQHIQFIHTYISYIHTYISYIHRCIYVWVPDPTAISNPISPAGSNRTDAHKSVQQTT